MEAPNTYVKNGEAKEQKSTTNKSDQQFKNKLAELKAKVNIYFDSLEHAMSLEDSIADQAVQPDQQVDNEFADSKATVDIHSNSPEQPISLDISRVDHGSTGADPVDTFHLFPYFPAEVQLLIWEEALPNTSADRQTVEMEWSKEKEVWFCPKPSVHAPCALLRACKASRDVYLTKWFPLAPLAPAGYGRATPGVTWGPLQFPVVHFNPTNDFLYIACKSGGVLPVDAVTALTSNPSLKNLHSLTICGLNYDKMAYDPSEDVADAYGVGSEIDENDQVDIPNGFKTWGPEFYDKFKSLSFLGFVAGNGLLTASEDYPGKIDLLDNHDGDPGYIYREFFNIILDGVEEEFNCRLDYPYFEDDNLPDIQKLLMTRGDVIWSDLGSYPDFDEDGNPIEDDSEDEEAGEDTLDDDDAWEDISEDDEEWDDSQEDDEDSEELSDDDEADDDQGLSGDDEVDDEQELSEDDGAGEEF